jgi:hypothetical protein
MSCWGAQSLRVVLRAIQGKDLRFPSKPKSVVRDLCGKSRCIRDRCTCN